MLGFNLKRWGKHTNTNIQTWLRFNARPGVAGTGDKNICDYMTLITGNINVISSVHFPLTLIIPIYCTANKVN